MRRILFAVLFGLTSAAALVAAEPAGFSFKDKAGDSLDVLLDGKPVARYMYAYDKSTPEKLHDTYKPYLHVFDADGAAPITKGPGGQFTHHRGIFVGWMKIGHKGKTYDRWHMKGGDIIHQKFSDQKAGPNEATFTSATLWNDEAGKPIIEEARTMTVKKMAAPWRLAVDLTTKIKAVDGDITLDGDPEHAGVQFRPANEIDPKQTVYVYPKEGAAPHKDLDYPWVGETFSLNGKKHSVVVMSQPDNPKGTLWSAYRNYGRFGAFPRATIKAGDTLTLKYRFLIGDGEMPDAAAIQKAADEFTGVTSPSPAPKTTVLPAEGNK
jgi:hypothetical protein